jgi:uncharacterized membrane protein
MHRTMTSRDLTMALATVFTGLFAGFFWTYTVSIPPGLGLLDDAGYVTAFQAINATIRNAPFGIVFFGTVPAIALALAVHGRAGGGRRVLLSAALVLAAAVVVVTFIRHIPLNDALAAATPGEAPAARAAFEATWNRWNLLRTVFATGALGCLAAVGVLGRPGQADC